MSYCWEYFWKCGNYQVLVPCNEKQSHCFTFLRRAPPHQLKRAPDRTGLCCFCREEDDKKATRDNIQEDGRHKSASLQSATARHPLEEHAASSQEAPGSAPGIPPCPHCGAESSSFLFPPETLAEAERLARYSRIPRGGALRDAPVHPGVL